MKRIFKQDASSTLTFLGGISTIPFAVFFSSLTLILTSKYALRPEQSAVIASTFLSLHYMLSPAGNYLCKRLGNRYVGAFFLGKIFSAIGVTILALGPVGVETIIFGLSLVLIDSMVSVIALQVMLADFCDKRGITDSQPYFLSLHRAINVGFVLGILMSGLFLGVGRPDLLLGSSAVVSILCAGSCAFIFSKQGRGLSIEPKLFGILLLSVAVICPALSILNISDHLRLVIMVGIGALSLYVAKSKSVEIGLEHKKMRVVVAFMFMSIIFWTVYMLEPAFFPQFINTEVNTTLGSLTFPPHVLQIMSPLFVIAQTGFLKRRIEKFGRYSYESQASMGMFSLFLAIAVISVATGQAMGQPISFIAVLIALFFLSFSESLISPLIVSIIADLVPGPVRGLFMSIYRVIIGLSGICAALILNKYLVLSSDLVSHAQIQQTDSQVFLILSIIPMLLSVGLFVKSRIR